MSRRFVALLATAGLLAVAFAIGPTVAVAGDPCFHEFDNRPATSSGGTSQVNLGDCVFTPTVTSVAVGTTVTWRNTSSQSHEVVGSNLTWGAHDKLLDPGDSIGWTFDKAGVYGYSCMIHPGMTGAIVVGSVAEAGTTAVSATEPTDEAGVGGPSAQVVGLAAGAGGLAVGLFVARLLRRDRAPAA